MADQGILTVVSGFSGSGKGTIMKELMRTRGERYALSISATTRDPRPGERDGVEYFFVSTEEFERMIGAGELIEHARYVDHYYGTPKKYVMEQLSAGKNVILEIEIQGALNVKKQFPDALLVFVSAPSAEILHDRLSGRGTEEPDVISARLSRAVEESKGLEKYDYLLINDTVEESAALLDRMITGRRDGNGEDTKKFLISENAEWIDRMRKSLAQYKEGKS
ncbi:MAG: guanylate kinase [Clostridiales bacterium]|nr:guanylate kinase [Clostridiales bacterium]